MHFFSSIDLIQPIAIMKVSLLFWKFSSLMIMWLCMNGGLFSREFTDTKGRKLDGEIVSVDAGQATLKLANGGLMPIALTTFSAADQKYIQEWAAQNVKYNFEVKVGREKVGAAKKKVDDSPLGGLVSSVLKEQEEKWVYKLSLRNLARSDATGLVAKYWIFRREDTGKAIAAPVLEVSGSKSVADAKKGAIVEVVTDPVTLTKTQLQGGLAYADGARNNTSDKMGGVVLRLFKEDRQIFEFATDEKLKAAAKDGLVAEKK
jgi:hypothetical protein